MDGHPVDRKPYNWHMSMRPGVTNTTAGTDQWTDAAKYPAGCIPAGAIVQEHQSESDRIETADGTDDELLLGVAIYTRGVDDARLQTYTIDGVVEMLAGTGGVTAGDYLMPDTDATRLGCAIDWVADFDGTNAESLTAAKKKFGKALTTATEGNRFWAYVDFKQ